MADVYDRLKRLAKLRETPNRASLIQVTDVVAGSATPPGVTSTTPSTPPVETPPDPTPSGTGGTLTFVVAPADDQTIWSQGASYPPTGGTIFRSDSDVVISPAKIRHQIDPTPYYVYVGLLKFNTSAIPDTANIASAFLRLMVTEVRNDSGDRSLTVGYESWNGTDADYTTTVGTSANGGIPLGSIGAGTLEIPLSSPNTSIVKDGTTYFKLHISGGAPPSAGVNWVKFTSADSSADGAKLIVAYV